MATKTEKQQRRKVVSFGGKKLKNLQRDRQHDNGLIQSTPAAPTHPAPPAGIRIISIFFALEGNFPGAGTLELSNQHRRLQEKKKIGSSVKDRGL